MGFGVGLPMMKLSNHPSSKSSRGRTGTLRSIACEALEERWGRDPDINRELTPYNEYQGIRSGLELTEALTQDAEAYSQQRKAAGGRALRSEAAIGFVAIIKPDMEAIDAMTPDQRRRFFRDAEATLDELLNKDAISGVLQVDELAWHEHRFYNGRLPDGTLCVDKLVCPKTFDRVNRQFPAMMREKGWEVDDCEMYDQERAKNDPEYVEERRKRREEQGQTSRKYKLRKQREQQQQLDKQQEAQKAKEAALAVKAKDQQHITEAQARTRQKIQDDRASVQKWAGELSAWQDGEQRRLDGLASQIAASVPASDAAIVAQAKKRKLKDGRTLWDALAADAAAEAKAKQAPAPNPAARAAIEAAQAEQRRLQEKWDEQRAGNQHQGPGLGG